MYKILVVWVDLGHNLNLIEKYEKLVRKKWRHHFSTREILPEDSPTSSQKLTFETNGKTLAPTNAGVKQFRIFRHV